MHGGAEIQSVEPYSIAWRAGLRWSDVLITIKVFSTLHPGEVLKEHVVTDGYSAAKALRPATGMLELHIIRRPTTAEDAAAADHPVKSIARNSLAASLAVVQDFEAFAKLCQQRALERNPGGGGGGKTYFAD